MDDRRILSTTRQTSSEVARVTFATVRKGGLDPQEVRLHLESVSREMAHLEQRVRELQDHLSEANRRAANPVIDESMLASALGTQSAAILRSAHEEAGRVTAEAQERATQLYADAQQRSAAHLIEAQERAAGIISEAESSAASIDHDARLAAERLIESAKVNGEALVERAREQGRAILAQATDARRTVLSDLAIRRKALSMQIEQLRAARDHLGAYIGGLRDEVETLLAGLSGSDESARLAAIEALRLRPAQAEATEEELLAGTPLRHVPDVVVPELSAEPGAPAPAPSAPAPSAAPVQTSAPEAPVVAGPTTLPAEDDQSGADVVNEIFARLRKATLEERGASAQPPRRGAPKVEVPDTPVGDLFKRRDLSLEESLAVLTRRIKRVLQDDQNVTLERLRSHKQITVTELEDEHAQRARYADAAYDALADAAAAGAQFAFDETGAAGGSAGRAPLVDCAADLAVTVVLALRRRILADGHADPQEAVNTAYKEWRGARVERLCADAARRAFHIGVAAAATGRPVRFLVAPGDPPCDACALDAAAGVRESGLSFPSGAAYPPLHAGCACAIVPA